MDLFVVDIRFYHDPLDKGITEHEIHQGSEHLPGKMTDGFYRRPDKNMHAEVPLLYRVMLPDRVSRRVVAF